MNKAKRFGQHFLIDQQIIQKIIAVVAPKESDHFLEIGPGKGALTAKILPLVKRLDVVEVDRDVIPALEQKCKTLGNLHIHIADILQFDLNNLQIVSSDKKKIRVVGNLPYNISTPILFYSIKNINKLNDLYFMVQKEVAERIAADHGSKIYGRLSVMLQYYFQTSILFNIPPTAFSPSPKVNSSFIRLTPRVKNLEAIDQESFANIVRTAFSKRRKTIQNSLKEIINNSQLENLGIDPNARAENLSVENFIAISNFLTQK